MSTPPLSPRAIKRLPANHQTALGTQAAPSTQNAPHAQHMRDLVVETPVAIVFNGTTAAIMMATPDHLRDLAYGFAKSEGYIAHYSDIESFEEVAHSTGIEARLWVKEDVAEAISARRRMMAGPVGCGLCGLESLDQVAKPLPQVQTQLSLTAHDIARAVREISAWQPLKQRTRSAHAAGFYVPGAGIVAAREDVGRHNALDKLIGALQVQQLDPAQGAFFMTSRLSLELVQKTALAGSGALMGISGPSDLAVQTAAQCGVQLFGFCRDDGFETYP